MKQIIHKINPSNYMQNICDGTTRGNYGFEWSEVTCKKCLAKRKADK